MYPPLHPPLQLAVFSALVTNSVNKPFKLFRSKMESDTEESLSPMLLEMSPDSPPPDGTKKRAWPRHLQIPLGVVIVGLVGGGVLCFLSLADSNEMEMVNAFNLSENVDDFLQSLGRDRRNLLLSCGDGCNVTQPQEESDCTTRYHFGKPGSNICIFYSHLSHHT